MANRWLNDAMYSFERAPVKVYGCALGAGAADLVMKLPNADGTTVAVPGTGYHGIKSITHNATGDYTINFTDQYVRLLALQIEVFSVDNSTAPTVVNYWVKAMNTKATGGATVRVFFSKDATPGTGVDLTSNSLIFLEATFSNSTAI